MYNHNLIEKYWLKKWQEDNVYKFVDETNKNKFYVLDMFPYPSGKGLHVGHPKGYTATDIIARYKKLNNFCVLHPIGWDAFGLPAEQYALETGNNPNEFTQKNIAVFREQLKKLGFSYDYSKEVDTTDPNYYQWTQWIFVQLYKKGLAEIRDVDVNWCENLRTVLSNEEVIRDEQNNLVSERGNHLVTKKPMKQWVLKITEYADKLIDGLDSLDWSDSLKSIQKKWIGKSSGYIIKFPIKNSNQILDIFTTKPETIFGVEFIAIAADYLQLDEIIQLNNQEKDFIAKVKNLKDFERSNIAIPNGIKLSIKCIHPITNKEVDVYLADYVLANYATGIIMGVPSCDERDLKFANQMHINSGLPIIDSNNCMINSDFVNILKIDQARNKIIEFLKKKNSIENKVFFKLKDWLFSRQRYWGEPFPVLYDQDGKISIVDDLPILLPKTDKITPSIDGGSPLANLNDWLYVEIDNKKYKRDTNTMPQWAGSCWYYLAYILKNEKGYLPLNSKQAYDLFKRWLPVDCYIGGQEHAVLHLLYARFWHHFLYDINVVPTKEPFQKVINQGMILDESGQKMSKSKGNIINPDEIIVTYGADALRLYEMFMGPLNSSLAWKNESLVGVRKWLDKVYRLYSEYIDKIDFHDADNTLEADYHLFIKNITNYLENNFQFNMCISEMMIFINKCYKASKIKLEYAKGFLIILSCFAPFIAEELWQNKLNIKSYIYFSNWPIYNEQLIKSNMINFIVQINGKLKKIIPVENSRNWTQQEIIDLLGQDQIVTITNNKKIIKIIYVQNKIINFVVK